MKVLEIAQLPLLQRLQQQAGASLDQMIGGVPGLVCGVINTADGVELAARGASAADSARLVAMLCSVSALGMMLSKEAAVGLCQSVLIEAAAGYVLMLDVPHPQYPMTLSLILMERDLLGQALYRAKGVAQLLVEVC